MKMRTELKFALCVFLYLQTAYATGAYFSNHRCEWSRRPAGCEIATVITGIGWPIYWQARFWLWATR
jgi:hypothetical protein